MCVARDRRSLGVSCCVVFVVAGAGGRRGGFVG